MSYGMEPAGTDTLSYGTANELLSLNTTTYGYDAKGNRTLKTEAGGSTTYSYDDENRLVRVEIPGSPALVITYTYDPFGRRIEKNVNGTITRYLYDREDILLEYNGAGSIAARYLHGPGIDEPLALEKDGQTYYYQADGLGSVIALADSAGGIAQTYRYDAFGSLVSGDPAIAQPYTYTAREWDTETGLYYYRARHYDPIAGRFLQRDPIGFAGGDVNLYAYVQNNPVNLIDPNGQDALQTFTNYSAGVGDALLLGTGPYLRAQLGIEGVDRNSTAYSLGSYTSLAFGGARLAYAGLTKGASILASSGEAASAFRESLKAVFRMGIGTNWRKPDLLKYATDPALREAAGSTNPFVNAYGAGVAAAGASGAGGCK